MFNQIDRMTLLLGVMSPADIYRCSKVKKASILDFPECAVCGSTKNLEAHHITPVHMCADYAFERGNLITLCDFGNKGCHYRLAHKSNFVTGVNPAIVELAVMSRISCGFGVDVMVPFLKKRAEFLGTPYSALIAKLTKSVCDVSQRLSMLAAPPA